MGCFYHNTRNPIKWKCTWDLRGMLTVISLYEVNAQIILSLLLCLCSFFFSMPLLQRVQLSNLTNAWLCLTCFHLKMNENDLSVHVFNMPHCYCQCSPVVCMDYSSLFYNNIMESPFTDLWAYSDPYDETSMTIEGAVFYTSLFQLLFSKGCIQSWVGCNANDSLSHFL